MRVNVARHDADLAAARKLCIRAFATHAPRWSDDAWAVGSDETGLALALKQRFHSDHIKSGDTLSDAYDEFNL